MKAKIVKEIMVPLSEYATVSEDDTLAVAINRLTEGIVLFLHWIKTEL